MIDTIITWNQIRAGVALAEWTLADLAQMSGVAVDTIRKASAKGGRLDFKPEMADRIRQAFTRAGLEFADGGVSRR